jgi:hypothetical protein
MMQFNFFPTSVLAAVFSLSLISSLAKANDRYSGHTVVLTTAEYLTLDGISSGYEEFVGSEAGIEVIQRDTGNGQLSQDFVYGDPRNALFDDGVLDISYAVAENNTSADVNLEDQVFWLYEAAQVWADETCSNLNLTIVGFGNDFPGIVNIFFQTGQIPLIQQADLTQVGFLSAAEFPYFAANPNVLGVAFTLAWVDADGNLTDIDRNRKTDVAFREIYYNDEFEWSDNGVGGERGSGIVDFPTVAIHESGHGLSAAHFGTIALKDGELTARPRTVMNAIYGGALRDLTGRDVATHCSNWTQWPRNQPIR